MAVADVLERFWNEWGLQLLVLLSFALQVKLIVFAELRRRIGSGVLRAFGWLAYVMADTTAIYVLGHMATVSRLPEHRLMPFWAPFLLLHLGGQDNITAYALEDNKLWLRHAQTLGVQVAGAAYVLYKSTIFGGWSFLSTATVLMSLAGVLRYGERVWALKCAGTSPAGDNYRPFERRDDSVDPRPISCEDTEAFLLTAHKLLDVPRDLIQGPSPVHVVHSGTEHFGGKQVYKVVEMQLSLMHDVFYTKAEVMRTWYGLCIRIISPLATAAALWQFHLFVGQTKGEGYSRLDVDVTYVLLAGAVILEAVSVSRMMFSCWTCALLVRWSFHARAGGTRRKIWDLLGRKVASLRRLVHAADWRGRCWPGSLGQHNLIQLCARSKASQRSTTARWMGMEDPWNTWVYSSSVPVSEHIENLVLKLLLKSRGVQEGNPEHIINSRGMQALKRSGLDDDLGWSVSTDISLEETILVWHIATDVYLRWHNNPAAAAARAGRRLKKEERQDEGDDEVKKAKTEEEMAKQEMQDVAQATETLSNYMLFLLAVRPNMLPPPASRNAYIQTCYDLSAVWCASVDDLATSLRHYGVSSLTTESLFDFSFAPRFAKISKSFLENKTIERGCQLAIKLISLHLGCPDNEANLEGDEERDFLLYGTEWNQEIQCTQDSPAEEIQECLPKGTGAAASSLIADGDKHAKQIKPEILVSTMAELWTEILCYAGFRCSPLSHAGQLSNGGDFITIIALLLEYLRRGIISSDPSEDKDGIRSSNISQANVLG